MSVRSIPSLLRRCAQLQPNDTAYTFLDFEQDENGVALTLTWAQMHRRMLNAAREFSQHGAPGDRAVILAPQGMEYIAAFLGALQAGLIAVPLAVPQGGILDERVDSVLRDAQPTVILTTSKAIDDVVQHVTAQEGQSTPAIIEVDRLDLDARVRSAGSDDRIQHTAYLQYTSGSTRTPAGVMMSHENLRVNFGQMMAGYFAPTDGVGPADMTLVSWLPFFHDLGLYLGVCAPILGGFPTVLTSPASFLQRPARWIRMMADSPSVFSAAPNFAYDLAAKKTSDQEIAGLDLRRVNTIVSGAERVQPTTIKRFIDRFSRVGLNAGAVRPAYGLAEATLYVANARPHQPPKLTEFDAEELAAGRAKKCAPGAGTALITYLVSRAPLMRIVDPDTCTECPDGTVGEMWVHGDNCGAGYWGRPEESEQTFGATMVAPAEGTPQGPWLRTGDLGFFLDGELFILGRLKDLLIVYGRNHSPDDIEATIGEITRGRCAAIAVPGDRSSEKLVAIVEFKKRPEDDLDRLVSIKREVTSALSSSHGLSVADLVLVPPGSIPITTSGKVRRRACVEQYRQDQFARLDV